MPRCTRFTLVTMGYKCHSYNTKRSRFVMPAFSYRCLNETNATLRGFGQTCAATVRPHTVTAGRTQVIAATPDSFRGVVRWGFEVGVSKRRGPHVGCSSRR